MYDSLVWLPLPAVTLSVWVSVVCHCFRGRVFHNLRRPNWKLLRSLSAPYYVRPSRQMYTAQSQHNLETITTHWIADCCEGNFEGRDDGIYLAALRQLLMREGPLSFPVPVDRNFPLHTLIHYHEAEQQRYSSNHRLSETKNNNWETVKISMTRWQKSTIICCSID